MKARHIRVVAAISLFGLFTFLLITTSSLIAPAAEIPQAQKIYMTATALANRLAEMQLTPQPVQKVAELPPPRCKSIKTTDFDLMWTVARAFQKKSAASILVQVYHYYGLCDGIMSAPAAPVMYVEASAANRRDAAFQVETMLDVLAGLPDSELSEAGVMLYIEFDTPRLVLEHRLNSLLRAYDEDDLHGEDLLRSMSQWMVMECG